MLYRAVAQNFGSIKSRQVLDFTISGKVEMERDRQLIGPSQLRVPRVSVILGANASGKTTALRAISFIIDFANNSANYPAESSLFFYPFSDAESAEMPTELVLEFTADWLTPGKELPYRYSISTTPMASNPRRGIATETLEFRGSSQWSTLMNRVGSELEFKRDFMRFSGSVPKSALARQNVSAVSLLMQFVVDDTVVNAMRHTLASVQTNFNFWFRSASSRHGTAEVYAKNKEALSALNKFIKKADLGIMQVAVEEFKTTGRSDSKDWFMHFHHSGLNGILLEPFESHGTMNFVTLFPYIYNAIESGGLALMDELDSDLHPELLREVANLFMSEETNPKGAQLIMTCNNPTILDHLRKEEIYFASKDNVGRTTLYALKDIPAVRRGANFQRDYLAGRYGAVPHIG